MGRKAKRARVLARRARLLGENNKIELPEVIVAEPVKEEKPKAKKQAAKKPAVKKEIKEKPEIKKK